MYACFCATTARAMKCKSFKKSSKREHSTNSFFIFRGFFSLTISKWNAKTNREKCAQVKSEIIYMKASDDALAHTRHMECQKFQQNNQTAMLKSEMLQTHTNGLVQHVLRVAKRIKAIPLRKMFELVKLVFVVVTCEAN